VNTTAKIGAFVVGLLVIFGAAAAVGGAIGPLDTSASSMEHGAAAEHDGAAMSAQPPGGLQVAQHGYRLALADPQQQPAQDTALAFTIVGPDGAPLTDYATLHDKKLHLVLAKRDLSGFQHVHPALDAAGTWTATVDLDPGQWRVFADFDPAGNAPQTTLGADLAVTGELDPVPLPAASRTATVGHYTVRLDGDAVAGAQSTLTLSVAKDGTPVTDLQPYLGAYGHLVALRDGDLAYLHVHPEGEPGDGGTEPGPDVSFVADLPSAGRYRLYLDFKHGDVVRTAEFTIEAAAPDASAAEHEAEPATEHSH
jgi:hypothetical protein